MMGSLARYAEVNAVIRARLSDLLTPHQYDELIQARDVFEAWNVLRSTAYGEWLPEGLHVEPLVLERALSEATALRFKHVLRSLREKPRDVALTFLCRWELDALEDVLRAWHARDRNLQSFVPDVALVHAVPFSRVAEAKTIEAVAEALGQTPYAQPILDGAQIYRETASLFHVELALEKDHYVRLFAAIKRLGGKDAAEARRILGAEVDLINLAWLSRCASYKDATPALIREALIPCPSPITQKLQESGTALASIAEVSHQFLQHLSGGEDAGALDTNRIALIESLIVQSAAGIARHLFSGYPFSITCVIAYYFLLRVELRNLRALFAGKACGVLPEGLSSRLYGLG